MVFLPGGPPHQDMWDIKMDAPARYAGSSRRFRPRSPGLKSGRCSPKSLRSRTKQSSSGRLVGGHGDHYSFQCLTGQHNRNMPPGGWPRWARYCPSSMGPRTLLCPPMSGCLPRMGHMLGPTMDSQAFWEWPMLRLLRTAKAATTWSCRGSRLIGWPSAAVFLPRSTGFRNEVDRSGMMGESTRSRSRRSDPDQQQAGRCARYREGAGGSARSYGRGVNQLKDDGGPRLLDNFLTARRLIDEQACAASLCLSVSRGLARRQLRSVSHRDGDARHCCQCLIEDLEQRGMWTDVTVSSGRVRAYTQDQRSAGRDHWPQVSCAMLAGGGLRTGQVIGKTKRLGEYAADRPVHFQEVLRRVQDSRDRCRPRELPDLQGRPRFDRQNTYHAMPELI